MRDKTLVIESLEQSVMGLRDKIAHGYFTQAF
jgi:uncharacterized protein with HEPN domain